MSVEDGGENNNKEKDVSAMVRMAQEALEKRRFERMKAGLQIKYRPVGPTEEATLAKQGNYAAPEAFKASSQEMQDFNKVACEDVSLGGLKINTPFPLAEGTHLWLQVGIPGVPMSVNALAEVRWSRRAGSLCSSGLKFTGISNADLAKVERYLALQKPPEIPKRA